MSQQAIDRYVAALTKGDGLHDDFIYSMSWEDYTNFPDPFARTVFTVNEVEARIGRYPNPAKPGELFQWDIHGRLFMPARNSITDPLNRAWNLAPMLGWTSALANPFTRAP